MKKSALWGIVLILLGGIMLADKVFDLQILSAGRLWPLFVLIPGLIFELSFLFDRRSPGLLVPGGILTTLGLLFLFETFTNWNFAEYTWPVYPLSVAIGLFQLYLFDRKNWGLLIPVGILGGVSIIAFSLIIYGNVFIRFGFSVIFGILLVALGILLLFNTYIRKR